MRRHGNSAALVVSLRKIEAQKRTNRWLRPAKRFTGFAAADLRIARALLEQLQYPDRPVDGS
jgi:hypothetical protein